MKTSITIPRIPAYEPAQDYAWLRNIGMEHLQVLATKIWTDFNIHDPGITSLEALCFAITDLGSRTALPMEDLLASAENPLPVPGDCFHTAAEILPCNPVTFADFRKVVIDVPKVKNAWLKKATDLEQDIFVDCNTHTLKLTPPASRDMSRLLVTLSGVFDVMVLLEDDVDISDPLVTDPIIADIKRQLHRYRSLCEDFLKITIMKIEEISLCADIVVEPEYDIDSVMAEILFRINAFLDPRVNFYSIEDLLDKGKTIDQIFEGPLLQHGFIDEAELLAAERFKVIHASDLYNIVMDIPGVVSVNKLILNHYLDGIIQSSTGERWCLHLTDPDTRVPRLMQSRCKITFYKGLLPFVAVASNVENFLLVLNASYRHAKLSVFNPDLPIPAGRALPLNAYAPITNQFPMVYGIGPHGLDSNATDARKAQAKQFKAYLLFFEQILANYLSQLANVKNLFAWSDSETNIVPSYFTQKVEDIMEIASLYVPDYTHVSFPQTLQDLIESEDTRVDRRNRFLEHLIGRFAERMVEYSLIKFSNGGLAGRQELVNDKARFLAEYPILSRDRGKGFDMILHNDPPVPVLYDLWNSDNITGLQRRAGRLLGIDNVQRRSLALGCLTDFDIVQVGLKWHYTFEYPLMLLSGPITVEITGPDVCSYGEAEDMLEETLTLAADPDNYTTTAAPAFQIRDFDRFGPSAQAIFKITNVPGALGTVTLSVDQGSGPVIVIGTYTYGALDTLDSILDGLVTSITSQTPYCAKHTMGSDEMTITAPAGSEEDGNVYELLFTDVPALLGASIVDQFQGGEDGYVMGTSITFGTVAERDEALSLSPAFFAQNCDIEGMHIVEHILLRPKKSTDALMHTCIHCPPATPQQYVTCGAVFTAVPGFTPNTGIFSFKFVDANGVSIIRSKISGYSSATDRNAAMYQVYEFGASYVYYEMLQNISGRYYFNIRNAQGVIIATSTNTNYLTLQDATDIVNQLVNFFLAMRNPYQLQEIKPVDTDPCLLENDPYSFRISVILPGYATRFRNIDFRAFAERVIREETPAHIIAKICWISRKQMKDFEEEYQAWLIDNATYLDPDTDPPTTPPDLSGLLDSLRTLSNYFPVRAKLHDCTQGSDEMAIVLNQSNLGNA
jgi:hypothetical protein